MGKEAQTFRIEVRSHSDLKYFYFIFLLLLLIASIWSWPYYLANTYRSILSVLIFLAFAVQSYFLIRQQAKTTLSISDSGRVVHYAKHKRAGWLLSSSYVSLGFFVLIYRQELSNRKSSLVLFYDQMKDADQRRISRIIQSCKYSG